MARQMTTLDDGIIIEVVRKEEITEVPVYFKVDNHTKASMTYLQYVRLFNWQDAKEGNREELISFLSFAFGITFNQPQCYIYNYPTIAAVDSEVEIEDNKHLVRLSLQGDLERIILLIDDDEYRTLYTGKVCGYEDLDVYAEMYEKTVTLPSEVVLLSNQRPKFKVKVDGTKAIEFELGVTKDGSVICERVWGIKDWCNRTIAPNLIIENNSVNVFIDPTHVTSEEVLTISQERGKIDVEKVAPALQKEVSGWTWQGGEVVPLSDLSSDTKLRYHVPWSPYDYPFSPSYFMFTIDLRYGNPPTSTAAIDMSSACNGTLPCAPIIRASLDELPIVEEPQKIRIPIAFVIFGDGIGTSTTIENTLEFIYSNLNEETRAKVELYNVNIHYPYTPPCSYINEDFGYMLTGPDVLNAEDIDKEKLQLPVFGYFLLWSRNPEETPTWGSAGTWGKSWGLYNKRVSTACYDTGDWSSESDWGHGVNFGTARMIHELFLMIEGSLVGDYPELGYLHSVSYQDQEQNYGKKLPNEEAMASYGFEDPYTFREWLYKQITPRMVNELAEIAERESYLPQPPPESCIFDFVTPGYKVTVKGKEYYTPIEISIPVTRTEETDQGTLYEAQDEFALKGMGQECHSKLCAFIIPPRTWALDELTVSNCFWDISEKYTGSTSRLVIRLKDIEEDGDFLTDCFSGNKVICDKETLHKYLLDQTVSGMWWGLTDARRRALGERVIEEFGAFNATRYGIGDPDCSGTNIDRLEAAVCYGNAIIKACKINTCEFTNHYYYNDYYGGVDQADLRHCYTEEEYNLPCYYTDLMKHDHAVAALQVGEDSSDWNSWVFFQYNDTNIQPGSWQMPHDQSLEIYEFTTGFMGLPGGPPISIFYIPITGKPSPILRGHWIYVKDPVWLTMECCSIQYKVYSEEGVTYVGVAEANGIEEEGPEVFGSSCTSEGFVKLLTSKFPPGTNVNINLKRVDNKAETLDTKIITIPIELPASDWICPICGFKCDTCFDLDGHIQDEHTPGIYTLPNWAIDTRYCYECGLNFIGGTDEENKTAYQAHQDEFLYRHTQREVKEKLIGMGRESELPIYWLDPPSAPGYVNVIPIGYYIYIDRQYVGDSPKEAFCGPNRVHEIRLIDTSNTILLDEGFTVGEGETINRGGELPDIILDIPPPAPLPLGTCRVVIPTAGYTATVEEHSYTSPLEFFIPIEADGGGPIIVASGIVKLAWDNSVIKGTLELFRLRRDPVWTVDRLRTMPTLMSQIYDYISTEEGVVLVMKPSEVTGTITKEELEKQLSGLDLENIDWKTLTSCTPNWILSTIPSSGIGTIEVTYEKLPIRVDVSYKRPNVSIRITDDWAPIRVIDRSLADQIVTDIASTPHNLSFTTDDFDDTEGLMLYSNAIVEWEKAIAAFPSYYREFIERLEAGYDFDTCVCQLNYKVLRPLTHWIETPTFIDPAVNWFYDETEEIYKSIQNCKTQECVKEHLDLFYSKMLQLYNQFPTINVPYFTITSEYPISAEVQEFDGSWHTVGVSFKSLEVKINEEGPTNVRFYDIHDPSYPPGAVVKALVYPTISGSTYYFRKQELNGTIDIPASDIPTTLYQQTPSAFSMHVINTGTAKAEYQIAITFEGIDVANEEVFWSDWSSDIAPNESIMLPVPVEISERAIPSGMETAEYNINTKLVAR